MIGIFVLIIIEYRTREFISEIYGGFMTTEIEKRREQERKRIYDDLEERRKKEEKRRQDDWNSSILNPTSPLGIATDIYGIYS
jgi:transposase